MARNNGDRLGADRMEAASSPSAAVAAEPTGLSFSTPTEFVELPSGGRFYPEGHPLHGKDSIEIKFMTAKEEDILTSKTLLKKGVAVDRMLQSIIIDPKIRVDDLLVGDKNALIVAARVSGYGENYATRVSCPACSTVKDIEFDLQETVLEPGGYEGSAVTGPTEKGTFNIELPKLKANVEVKLLDGKDEKRLLQMAEMKRKNKLQETTLTDQLRISIVSVNGDSEKATINKLIDNMPAFDSRFVRSVISKLMPNIDMRKDFTCDACEYSAKVEVPFTVEFFWPR